MIKFENILTWNQKTRTFELRDLVAYETRSPFVRNIGKNINCEGLLAIPHAFDIHVHFREPGYTHKEDFYTGSQAALFGGVTAVLDMPNTNPPTLTKKDILTKKRLAEEKAIIDVFIAVAITNQNADTIKEVDEHADAYKVFLGETFGKLAINADNLHKALASLEELETEKTIIFHAESQEIIEYHKHESTHEKQRPPEAEAEAIQKVLELASQFPTLHFHITHISSNLGKKIIEMNNLCNVTTDTCPRYLLFDDNSKFDYCLKKVNPPIRTEMDRMALLQAISVGIIDMISSDHSPHTIEEKQQQCLSGMPGVQELLPLTITLVKKHELTWERAIEAFHSFPAKIFRLEEQTIDNGNYVIVNSYNQFEVSEDWIKTKVGWSPYSGWHLYGKPIYVIKGDKLIMAT